MTALAELKLSSVTRTNKLMVKKYEDGNVLLAIEGRNEKDNKNNGMFMVMTPEQTKMIAEFLK